MIAGHWLRERDSSPQNLACRVTHSSTGCFGDPWPRADCAGANTYPLSLPVAMLA